MSHCATYEEALQKHGKEYVARLEAKNFDVFYDKKRYFPHSEERLYDDIPPRDLVLVRPGYPALCGLLCKARFLPNTNTCIISETKRSLERASYHFYYGLYAATSDQCYRVEEYHYDIYPKYAILNLVPIEDEYSSSCFNYVVSRAKDLV